MRAYFYVGLWMVSNSSSFVNQKVSCLGSKMFAPRRAGVDQQLITVGSQNPAQVNSIAVILANKW